MSARNNYSVKYMLCLGLHVVFVRHSDLPWTIPGCATRKVWRDLRNATAEANELSELKLMRVFPEVFVHIAVRGVTRRTVDKGQAAKCHYLFRYVAPKIVVQRRPAVSSAVIVPCSADIILSLVHCRREASITQSSGGSKATRTGSYDGDGSSSAQCKARHFRVCVQRFDTLLARNGQVSLKSLPNFVASL